MRVAAVAMGCLLLGSLLGLGLTWGEFDPIENQFDLMPASVAIADGSSLQGPRAMVVGETVFDFGKLGPQQSGDHTFVVRNDGDGDLELYVNGMTCGKCIQTAFEGTTLGPGETTEVPITYSTRKPGPEFAEHLEIGTNDHAHNILFLEVRGYVTQAVRASVESVNVGDVSANESKTVEVRISGYLSEDLEIASLELANQEHLDAFDVAVRRLRPEEFADDEQALVAHALDVTVKPGLPLGPINQTIRLETRADEVISFELPIRGTVVSDITFVGVRGLDSKRNRLYFGAVDRKQGKKASLRMLVKGPYREEVQLKIAQVDPEDVLHAAIGEKQMLANGAIVMYPLTVEVVKNARIANRLGTDQAKVGRILIETTHPLAKEVELWVGFATE